MHDDRLKLVVAPRSPEPAPDDSTEVHAAATASGSRLRQLRLVHADEGPPPDDAA